MASGPRKALRLPIMWAITNPMKRMPLMATRTFIPMVVRMAAGSRVCVAGMVAAVMESSVLPGPGNALLGASVGGHVAAVAIGCLQVGPVEGQLQREGAGDLGCEGLDGGHPYTGVGGDVAAPIPPVLAARPHQPG